MGAERPRVGPGTFRAADGSTWSAHAVALGDVSWARAARCLVFQSELAIRRVWQYPADWRALPDAALEAPSWDM